MSTAASINFPTPTTIQSMFKYKILVLLYCCCTDTSCCHNIEQSLTKWYAVTSMLIVERKGLLYGMFLVKKMGMLYMGKLEIQFRRV